MIQEYEAIMLLIGIIALAFQIWNREQLRSLDYSSLLIIGFHFIITGWLFTVLEGFFWGKLLNFLEHFCYLISAIIMTVWAWLVFIAEEKT